MQYGPLTNDDAAFRAVCLALARHPVYSVAPLGFALGIAHTIERKQTFCAAHDGQLLGFIAWRTLPASAAIKAIQERKWPQLPSSSQAGDALALLALIAPSPNESLPFLRRFIASQRGRIIVYERHRPNKPSRLSWFDRSGTLMGDDLPVS